MLHFIHDAAQDSLADLVALAAVQRSLGHWKRTLATL
jgi:hypothetical protein